MDLYCWPEQKGACVLMQFLTLICPGNVEVRLDSTGFWGVRDASSGAKSVGCHVERTKTCMCERLQGGYVNAVVPVYHVARPLVSNALDPLPFKNTPAKYICRRAL